MAVIACPPCIWNRQLPASPPVALNGIVIVQAVVGLVEPTVMNPSTAPDAVAPVPQADAVAVGGLSQKFEWYW